MHRGQHSSFVPIAAVCTLLTAVVWMTAFTNCAFAQMPYVGEETKAAPPRPDSGMTSIGITNLPRLDTIYVFVTNKKGAERLKGKIPVHEHYEIIPSIAPICRSVFDIGSRSEWVTVNVSGMTSSYGAGVWTSFGSVSAGNFRLELHTRDGSTKEVTPLLKQPKPAKTPKRDVVPAMPDTTPAAADTSRKNVRNR